VGMGVKSAWMGGDGTKIPFPCTPLVVARMSDSRLAVMGSNPGHGIAGFSKVGDHFFRVNYLGM